jgi:hypothetical protein
MTDPSDKHKAFGTIRDLGHDRALAAALGDMIVAWADAERVLHDIMHRMTKMSYPMIADIFARVPTFESRVKIVQTVIDRWAFPDRDRDKVAAAIRKLSALSKTRNRWVHGSWVATIDRSLTVVFDNRERRGTSGHRRTVKAHDVALHVATVNERTLDVMRSYSSLRPK